MLAFPDLRGRFRVTHYEWLRFNKSLPTVPSAWHWAKLRQQAMEVFVTHKTLRHAEACQLLGFIDTGLSEQFIYNFEGSPYFAALAAMRRQVADLHHSLYHNILIKYTIWPRPRISPPNNKAEGSTKPISN